MLQIERINKILDLLEEKNIIKISELLKQFPGISKMTLWRDIKKLSNDGIVDKVHGGIMLRREKISFSEDSFYKRINEHKNAKKNLVQKAKELINAGDTIILDSSSTSYYLAEVLTDISDIKIITNNIKIANDLNFSEQTEIILTGGVLKQKTFSLIGPTAVNFFKDIIADWVFFSVAGISADKGALDFDIMEIDVKKAMIHSARNKCIIFDASKINNKGAYIVTNFEDIDYFILEKNNKLQKLNKILKTKRVLTV